MMWAACLYLLTQLALLAVKDRWRSIGPLNETRKWPRLQQLAADDVERPLAVMLGSSRVCWAFQAGRLSDLPGPDGKPYRFYNFGIPATGTIHASFYLKDMIAKGIHPKLLLLEYLPPLLCEPHGTWPSEEFFASMEWTSTRDLFRLSNYFSRHGHQKFREWIQSGVAPCYAYRVQIQDELRFWTTGERSERPPEVDEWGACILPAPPSPEKRAADLAQTVKFFGPALANFHPGVGPMRAFREIFELCRRQGIRVVVVITPESSTFRNLYTPESRATTRELLAQFVSEYKPDVIDANEWLPDEDFEDGHHVIAAGAVAFTVRLREELRNIIASPGGIHGRPSPVKRDVTEQGAEANASLRRNQNRY
jgi:hypothetical protein